MSSPSWVTSVGLAGAVGRDSPGDTYLEQVKGVDTGSVARKGRTGLAYIINSEERDRSIVVFPGSGHDLSDEDLDRERLGAARWIHMTSLVSRRGLEAQMKLKHDLRGKVSFSVDPGEIYAAMGQRDFSAHQRYGCALRLEKGNRAALRMRPG